MNEAVLRALLMSVASGMATMLGFSVIYLPRKNDKVFVALTLSFAAGVMLSVSFIELLPAAFNHLAQNRGSVSSVLASVFFVFIGAMSIYIAQKAVFPKSATEGTGKELYKLGIVSMLAMMLHNFPEGIAGFMAGYDGLSEGLNVLCAVAFHNIPEGITIALPIYIATQSKKTAFNFTLLSSVAEPLGALCAFFILRPFINGYLMGAVFAFTAGVMIYIALGEMIYHAYKCVSQLTATSLVICGICFMLVLHELF